MVTNKQSKEKETMERTDEGSHKWQRRIEGIKEMEHTRKLDNAKK